MSVRLLTVTVNVPAQNSYTADRRSGREEEARYGETIKMARKLRGRGNGEKM